MGTVAVYGLFSLTPKLRSPLKRSRINTPMCISPTRATKFVSTIIYNQGRFIHTWPTSEEFTNTYIDLHANHLNDTVWALILPERRNFLARSIKTFCCNRTSSKRIPVALDESVPFW